MENSTTKDILRHLQKHGRITGAEAYSKYHCYRLAVVISRLRRDYIISTVMTAEKGKHGKTSRYATYCYWGERKNAESENS